jgi:hypothetical protein
MDLVVLKGGIMSTFDPAGVTSSPSFSLGLPDKRFIQGAKLADALSADKWCMMYVGSLIVEIKINLFGHATRKSLQACRTLKGPFACTITTSMNFLYLGPRQASC